MAERRIYRIMSENSGRFQPKPLRIGNITVDPPLILAPMAGVTDSLYRALMADFGAGMVTTEMVSIQGLVRNQPKTWELCVQEPPLKVPLAVQIFGNDPAVMAEAGRLVEGRGVSVVDINAGCPVKKVVRQGAGASLLRDPDLLASMVEAVKEAVKIPVTVKVRLGWDSKSTFIVDLARKLSSAGADAISVHCRTAVQQYGDRADWSWISKVREAVDIPIIGNGDVTSPSLAEKMFRETGCDGVMIGRATLGNPWLIGMIASRWGYGAGRIVSHTWEDFYDTVRGHIESFERERPRSSGHLKKLLMWYSKGCPESAALRSRIMGPERTESLLAALRSWVLELIDRGTPFLPMKVPEAESIRN